MSDLICGKAAVGGNYNSTRDRLSDINLSLDLRMEVGGFLSFADFFFDGLVADYLVQSKIEDARRQVADAINMISSILNTLRGTV